MPENALFYVAVKACIFNGDTLLMTQGKDSMCWELPGGRINHDEIGKPFNTVLLREIEEELGKGISIHIGDVATHYLRTTHQGDPVFLVCIHCTWNRGEITLSPEDASYAWMTEKESLKLPLIKNFESALHAIWKYHNSLQP
ncbi:MAG: NUDIX domain-containing protein [Patescibacteria group bacterium]|jgi:8-oxo-dGTP pyrophosphatase MutT (NUDIX family)